MDAFYLSPLPVQHFVVAKPPQEPALAPHLISQRRMQELLAPESSNSATSSSGASTLSSAASSATPQSSIPTALTGVSDIEEKLASALLACRAVLEVCSNVSSDEDDLSDDEDDEFDEDESELDDDESVDDDSADDLEPEPALLPPRPDDTYDRRMRRVSAWRDAVRVFASGPPPQVSLSRKRKAEDDGESLDEAASKRARLPVPVASCSACGWCFPSLGALQLHGSPANPSEACRDAVAYHLEA